MARQRKARLILRNTLITLFWPEASPLSLYLMVVGPLHPAATPALALPPRDHMPLLVRPNQGACLLGPALLVV